MASPNAGAPCLNVVKDTLGKQFYELPFPYYSRVKFAATRVDIGGGGTGPWTYTLDANLSVSAFSYAIGAPATQAGYTAADGNATRTMTNLENPRQTIAGDRLWITGIGVIPLDAAQHKTDAADTFVRSRLKNGLFLAALMSSLSLELSLNGGRSRYKMGPAFLTPGPGGLLGNGNDSGLAQPHPFNGPFPIDTYASNGWPTRTNYFPVSGGLAWNPAGNDQSSLEIIFTVDRKIELVTGGYENQQANIAANNDTSVVNPPATGVEAFVWPTEEVQEFCVVLIGITDGPRSTFS